MLDRYFYTFHNPAGNRFVRGSGFFPHVTAIDIPLRGIPVWAVGYAMETAIWHIVLANGDLQVVEVSHAGHARTLAFQPGWFHDAQPPLVGVSMVEGVYVLRSDDSVSALTHPIPVNDFETLTIDRCGNLALGREDGILARMPANAQPDARLVMNSRGQVALYANATGQRNAQANIGAGSGAAALLVLEIRESQIRLLARLDLPGDEVFTGIAPFWADIDGDGCEDLLTTVSNSAFGARLRACLWDGAGIRQTVDSPAIGSGHRWRHQLSAGRFAPNGQIEIASLRSPHDAGELEFFRFAGDGLVPCAELAGFTSHVMGSRNLDQAAAGDFNGDGLPEVLVMDGARRAIVAVQRTETGAAESWRLDVDGEIRSNLSPVELLDGGMALAVGASDRRLRVWLPK